MLIPFFDLVLVVAGTLGCFAVIVCAKMLRRPGEPQILLAQKCTSFLSILLGTVDFLTDLAFAKTALANAISYCAGSAQAQEQVFDQCCDGGRASLVPGGCVALAAELHYALDNGTFVATGPSAGWCTNAIHQPGQSCGEPSCDGDLTAQCCTDLCDEDCNPRSDFVAFGAVTVAWMCTMLLMTSYPLFWVLRRHGVSGPCDRQKRRSQMRESSAGRHEQCNVDVWRRAPLFNRFIVAISITNLELLKLLPWNSDTFDGLPTAELLKVR